MNARQVVIIRRQFGNNPVLQIEQQALLLAILFDKRMQRVAIEQPLEQTAVLRERYHTVALNGQITPRCLVILEQQVVDEAEDLHDTLVLAQVLVAFQQEHVLAAVRAEYADLARPLFRAYNLEDRNQCIKHNLELIRMS